MDCVAPCPPSTFSSNRSIASSSSAPLRFRSIFHGSKLTVASLSLRLRRPLPHKSVLISACTSWENPPWSEDDFVVIGLAHCFRQPPGQKNAVDVFVVEPLSAGTLESMENGAPTSYRLVAASTLGIALQQSLTLLPPQFAAGESAAGESVAAEFAQDFEFRTRCASRTWKRPHAVSNLQKLLPPLGSVRSDFNFSIQHKRILNARNVVTDKDNIKQDMSIDVYGRDKEEKKLSDEDAQIESLYNL